MATELTSDSGILTAIRESLGFEDDTSQDNLIKGIIASVIETFNSATNRSFNEKRKATFQQFIYYGQKIRKIMLPNAPVDSITTVQSDDETVTYASTEYKFITETGQLIFSSYVSTDMLLEVEYKHGYSEIPADVGLAIFTQTLLIFDKRKDMATKGASGYGASVTYVEKLKMMEMNQEVIERYLI